RAREPRDAEVVGGTEVDGEALRARGRHAHHQRALGDRLRILDALGQAHELVPGERVRAAARHGGASLRADRGHEPEEIVRLDAGPDRGAVAPALVAADQALRAVAMQILAE